LLVSELLPTRYLSMTMGQASMRSLVGGHSIPRKDLVTRRKTMPHHL